MLLALGLGALLQGASAAERSQLRRWLEGPVRYIASDAEIKMYRALDSDVGRTRFIDRFWALRDPDTSTTDNEYRALFWSRVKEANDRFNDAAIPGWKTDRGRIHVLCGPPSRIEDQSNADTGSGPTAGRGLIRWIYEGRPCGRRDMGPVVIIPFVRQTTGEYRLSYDPKLSSLYWDPHDLREEQLQNVQRWLDFVSIPDRSELSIMADFGKLLDAPHPEEIVLERVETAATYGSHPIEVQVDRFRRPGGGIVVVLTLPAAESRGKRPPNFIARLTPRDPARTKRFLTEESFRLEGTGEDRIAQARIVVEAGTWDLTLLASEPDALTNGLYKGTVEVPAPASGTLALSDVVPARLIEPLPFASMASHDEPYRVGAFRVVPRPGGVVPLGEPVAIFYEVYGSTGPFRVEYRVEGREDDGRFTALGRPAVLEGASGSQGWSLPTSPSWPTGAYRVRIRVEDPSGASAEAIAPFTLR